MRCVLPQAGLNHIRNWARITWPWLGMSQNQRNLTRKIQREAWCHQLMNPPPQRVHDCRLVWPTRADPMYHRGVTDCVPSVNRSPTKINRLIAVKERCQCSKNTRKRTQFCPETKHGTRRTFLWATGLVSLPTAMNHLQKVLKNNCYETSGW